MNKQPKRRRILRVTPIDFARPGNGSCIGGLALGEALGYYRWLSLNIPDEHQRNLSHGRTLWCYKRAAIPAGSRALTKSSLASRLHWLILGSGHENEKWRKDVRIHRSQLMVEHRLPVMHWDEVWFDNPDRLFRDRLPFAPNRYHRTHARRVTGVYAVAHKIGWRIVLYYGMQDDRKRPDDREGIQSGWSFEFLIRSSSMSLAEGLRRMVDVIYDPTQVEAAEARLHDVDSRLAPVIQ